MISSGLGLHISGHFLQGSFLHDLATLDKCYLPPKSSIVSFSSKLPNTTKSIFSVMSALANEHNAINLSQGFPNFEPPKGLINLIQKHLESGHNQYAPSSGLPALRNVLANKINQAYLQDVNGNEEITITAGATQAIYTAISMLISPGDEAILIEPAYDSYAPAIEINEGRVVTYQLKAPSFKIDWGSLKGLVTDRTRLIILNTPHNPTGTVLRREDWLALGEIVKQGDIYIISDEVYEHLTYDGFIHDSILNYPKLFKRAVATYSFGKTFHSTGWRIGYCVAPANLMHEFRKLHQFTVFSMHTPTQYALAEFMEDPESYLSLPAFYQQKRDYLQKALVGTGLKPLSCEGTYFQLYDYSAIKDLPDVEFAHWLTKEIGLATIPISPFYSKIPDQQRLVRLCFAKTEEVLDKAGEVLRKGLTASA